MSDPGPAFVPSEEDVDFARLQSVATSALESSNFTRFSDFGNRHGSWELTFSKDDGGLHRFISLDITATTPPVSHSAQVFDVEIWISAEMGDRFMRRLIRRLTASHSDLDSKKIDDQLRDSLTAAAQICSGLTASDLIANYSRSLVRRTHE